MGRGLAGSGSEEEGASLTWTGGQQGPSHNTSCMHMFTHYCTVLHTDALVHTYKHVIVSRYIRCNVLTVRTYKVTQQK